MSSVCINLLSCLIFGNQRAKCRFCTHAVSNSHATNKMNTGSTQRKPSCICQVRPLANLNKRRLKIESRGRWVSQLITLSCSDNTTFHFRVWLAGGCEPLHGNTRHIGLNVFKVGLGWIGMNSVINNINSFERELWQSLLKKKACCRIQGVVKKLRKRDYLKVAARGY